MHVLVVLLDAAAWSGSLRCCAVTRPPRQLLICRLALQATVELSTAVVGFRNETRHRGVLCAQQQHPAPSRAAAIIL